MAFSGLNNWGFSVRYVEPSVIIVALGIVVLARFLVGVVAGIAAVLIVFRRRIRG